MMAVEEVRRAAAAGDLEICSVTAGSSLHVKPRRGASSVCGYVPRSIWTATPLPSPAPVCRQCLRQVKRAGYRVVRHSPPGAIVPDVVEPAP